MIFRKARNDLKEGSKRSLLQKQIIFLTCDSLLRHKESVGTLFGIGVQRGSFTPVERRHFGPPGFPGAPAVTFLPEREAKQST